MGPLFKTVVHEVVALKSSWLDLRNGTSVRYFQSWLKVPLELMTCKRNFAQSNKTSLDVYESEKAK